MNPTVQLCSSQGDEVEAGGPASSRRRLRAGFAGEACRCFEELPMPFRGATICENDSSSSSFSSSSSAFLRGRGSFSSEAKWPEPRSRQDIQESISTRYFKNWDSLNTAWHKISVCPPCASVTWSEDDDLLLRLGRYFRQSPRYWMNLQNTTWILPKMHLAKESCGKCGPAVA